MSGVEAIFGEMSSRERTQSVPVSFLSVQVGHVAPQDSHSVELLSAHFRRTRPWVDGARQALIAEFGNFAEPVEEADSEKVEKGRATRISTCVVVDDYSGSLDSPARVLGHIQEAGRDADLEIDYVIRLAAALNADGVDLTQLLLTSLVQEPPAGTDGMRPPTNEAGWLSNGQRSPNPRGGEAMSARLPWSPPVQNAARRHSVFLDIQLWDDNAEGRTWSSSFLGAVWQLARLGMLRDRGAAVAQPRSWVLNPLAEWASLPPVVALTPGAAPFCAYRTFSVLSARNLGTEHAVREILSQVDIDRPVVETIQQRSNAEGLSLPTEVVDRIGYLFCGAPWRDVSDSAVPRES